MAQAFHTHIYVSVNCTGLETLVLAFWSMARLLRVKSPGSIPSKYALPVKGAASTADPFHGKRGASLGHLEIGHVWLESAIQVCEMVGGHPNRQMEMQ